MRARSFRRGYFPWPVRRWFLWKAEEIKDGRLSKAEG